MNDLGVIDTFMAAFTGAVDSGFGLVSGDVATLTTILIGIDVTLAGLLWLLDEGTDVLARLIRKVLYVGAFAFILNNFASLANVVFRSFAGLGLVAAGSGLSVDDLLKPGRLAGIGFQAAWPLLHQAGQLLGFTGLVSNFLTIIVLLLAWFVVVIAFFILSVQLFITILEFKLTALAGFVLVPFALWNKTAFLAERVLGNVVSSGVKVMVLAVIVGIGSSFFESFVAALRGQEPSLVQAMALVLASLALLGLGIFGPGIAAGLVSGAPQLGAGAAIGTAGAAVGAAMLAGGAGLAAARMAGSGGLAAIRAGTAMGSAASSAYQLGQATSGASGLGGVAAGMGGVARAGAGAVAQKVRSMAGRAGASLAERAQAGREGAWRATGGRPTAAMAEAAATPPGGSPSGPPRWAQRLRTEQAARAHRHATLQAVREGDRPGTGANPSLHQKDD